MRKNLFLINCFLLISNCIFSQTLQKLKTIGDSIENYRNREINEIVADSTNEDYFSEGGYNKFFDKYFTQMKYERETFTEGNSASLKIADNKTRLNLTLSKKSSNTIFSVGTALNISDNSGVIFTDNKPSAGTEFFGSFSFLIPQWRYLQYKGPSADNNYRKRRELLDSLSITHGKRNPANFSVLTSKISTYDAMILRYEEKLKTANDKEALLYQDSLVQVIDKRLKTKLELESLDNSLTTAEDAVNDIITGAEKIGIEKELATDGVTYYRMFWLTTGLIYRKDNYATYDSLLVFSKRVGEKEFDKWTVNATLNFVWQRTDSWIAFRDSKFINSIYANLNYSVARTNTFESLKELSLSTIRIRTQNDTTYEFSSQKKLRDISTKTFETDWVHRLGAVGTFMMGKKQFFGLNLTGSTEMQQGKKAVLNSRLGTLFRFKDSENEKSKVNFELFFSFNDMSDTKKAGKSVWQRKEIGISANIPFQKVFFR